MVLGPASLRTCSTVNAEGDLSLESIPVLMSKSFYLHLPDPLRPVTLRFLASKYKQKTSPPIPVEAASVTFNAAANAERM